MRIWYYSTLFHYGSFEGDWKTVSHIFSMQRKTAALGRQILRKIKNLKKICDFLKCNEKQHFLSLLNGHSNGKVLCDLFKFSPEIKSVRYLICVLGGQTDRQICPFLKSICWSVYLFIFLFLLLFYSDDVHAITKCDYDMSDTFY